MIDPTFRNINRFFVLSFKDGNNDPTRDSFDKYYILLVKIENFNALIDNKPFFDQPVKNKQEAYENLIEMSRNDDYTTGSLLDFHIIKIIINSLIQIYQGKQVRIFLNRLILQENLKKMMVRTCFLLLKSSKQQF